ncbi:MULTISPECIES: hypothetical protein [unclassified Limnobacter]|uniref:hypothetical protein n=1 Tax=unclassified Limnobacter TaxID=2630203 RepID=UPI000C3C2600|nr:MULTISPECIES: hypothetical protein [unclassified Limnobacter]MAZ08699.1 hypothetical protein [Sutterellaceae bacterium]
MIPKVRNALFFWSIVFLLIAPLLMYFRQFHGPLSSDPDDWAKAGDFFGGIYSVVIGGLTLTILVNQATMQQRLEKFQYDQNYLVRARSDVEYYLDRLYEDIKLELPKIARNALNIDPEHRLNDFLNFFDQTSGKVFQQTNVSSGVSGRIFSSWLALHAILVALRESKETAYEQELTFALTKIHSRLSYSTAKAVEQFVSQIAGDRLGLKLFFTKGEETK